MPSGMQSMGGGRNMAGAALLRVDAVSQTWRAQFALTYTEAHVIVDHQFKWARTHWYQSSQGHP